MSFYEQKAIKILEKKGFTNLKKVSNESFDLKAEKEGMMYCVEVKGTSQLE